MIDINDFYFCFTKPDIIKEIYSLEDNDEYKDEHIVSIDLINDSAYSVEFVINTEYFDWFVMIDLYDDKYEISGHALCSDFGDKGKYEVNDELPYGLFDFDIVGIQTNKDYRIIFSKLFKAMNQKTNYAMLSELRNMLDINVELVDLVEKFKKANHLETCVRFVLSWLQDGHIEEEA